MDNCDCRKEHISIHAPAKGATPAIASAIINKGDFNPRSREGSDDSRLNFVFDETKNFNPRSREGSDSFLNRVSEFFRNFNPRSREGSDVDGIVSNQDPAQFQSTLPRRERPKQLSLYSALTDFNPRSREGSDHYLLRLIFHHRRFQSTLPRRERLLLSRRYTLVDYFNPRSREGSD